MARTPDGAAPLDLLQALCEKSVLGQAPGSARRFVLLSIREFAHKRLEARGALVEVARATAEVYVEEAEAWASRVRTTERRRWLDRLARERENLLAVLAWGVEHDPATAVRIALALDQLLFVRGPFDLRRRVLDAAVAVSGECDPGLRARALLARGKSLDDAGDPRGASDDFTLAARLAARVGDTALGAHAQNLLGLLALVERRWAEAQSHQVRAFDGARRAGDLDRAAVVANGLGLLTFGLGSWRDSESCYTEGIALAERLGSHGLEGMLHSNLGWLHRYLGHSEQANADLERALAACRRAGDSLKECSTLMAQGLIALIDDRPGDAAHALAGAHRIAAEAGEPAFRTLAQAALAALASHRDDVELAVDHIATARAILGERRRLDPGEVRAPPGAGSSR